MASETKLTDVQRAALERLAKLDDKHSLVVGTTVKRATARRLAAAGLVALRERARVESFTWTTTRYSETRSIQLLAKITDAGRAALAAAVAQ